MDKKVLVGNAIASIKRFRITLDGFMRWHILRNTAIVIVGHSYPLSEMEKDKNIIELFKKYDNQELSVTVLNGSNYRVKNIAWGYDMGDEFAHISTNISPKIDGFNFDFFSTDEIVKIVDIINNVIIYETNHR